MDIKYNTILPTDACGINIETPNSFIIIDNLISFNVSSFTAFNSLKINAKEFFLNNSNFYNFSIKVYLKNKILLTYHLIIASIINY
jgi:hypothetical protein